MEGWGWMMPGLAGGDCEAAGRGQPVEEKELIVRQRCLGERLSGSLQV